MHWQDVYAKWLNNEQVVFQNNGWATRMADTRERFWPKKQKQNKDGSILQILQKYFQMTVWNRSVLSFFNHERPLLINTAATCVTQPHWWRQSQRISVTPRLRACVCAYACVMTHQVQGYCAASTRLINETTRCVLPLLAAIHNHLAHSFFFFRLAITSCLSRNLNFFFAAEWQTSFTRRCYESQVDGT